MTMILNYELLEFTTLNSTNDYVKNLNTRHQVICVADGQTEGRGRTGKLWHSPPNTNLYCSFGLSWTANINNLSTLSLIISLAVVKTLEQYGINAAKIKWPNDIICNNKKISGILIESIGDFKRNWLIIGIGINVNMKPQRVDIDQPWTSILQELGHEICRQKLLYNLVINVDYYIELFKKHDLTFFLNEWFYYDYLINKKITIKLNNEFYTGIYQGIDHLGAVILKLPNKNIKKFISGEIVKTTW